jgi:hypothetical protein
VSAHKRNRADGNQAPIVEALKRIGARVLNLSQVGGGCPDLLVGFRGRNILMEVKQPGEKLKKEQAEVIAYWPAEVHVVRTPEEAVALVIGKEAMA